MANRRRVRSSPVSTSGDGAEKSRKARKTVDLGWSKKKDGHLDDLIESSSDEDNDNGRVRLEQESEEEEEEEETLDAKKIRLARQYLKKIESDDDDSTGSEHDDDDEESDQDKDRLGRKLQRQRMKRQGTLEYSVAKRIIQDISELRLPSIAIDSSSVDNNELAFQHAKTWQDAGQIQYFRGHDLTPTCVALQQLSGEKAISGAKDHSVLCWNIETGQKILQLCPSWKQEQQSSSSSNAASRNSGQVLAVACSDDGRYAAVGKRDATVTIFDMRISASKQSAVKTFEGHKGPVTCLAFRTQSRQLFSGSDDRCIRHYNLDEMLYVETLYGHQFGVADIDCHRQELPVSVGRDRTARVWKLAEDSHLIFRGGAKVASADAVAAVHDDWFLTGHEDGHLALWMSARKRPVAFIDRAHGIRTPSADNASADPALGLEQTRASDSTVGNNNGISSLAALKNSDMAATGSSDGYMRLWKVSTGKTLAERGIEPLANIPVYGYINGIAIGPKAKFCVVAVGQEPRLGRWNRIPKAKNRFGIICLRKLNHGEEEEDDVEDNSCQPKSTTVTASTKAGQVDVQNSTDDMSAES